MQKMRHQSKGKAAGRSKQLGRALALAVGGALAQFAHADATWVGGDLSGPQDWNIGTNWSLNPPSGNFFINTAVEGIYPIVSADSAFTPVDLIIGDTAGITGRLDQTAGILSTGAGNWVVIGRNGGSGTYNISGGTLNAGGIHLARSNNTTTPSVATFNVSGSATVNAGHITVSDGQNASTTSQGTINVDGGTLNSEGDLVIAFAGSGSAFGEVNIGVGGTLNVATTTERWLIVNQWDTTQGRLNINGGTLNLNTNTDLRFSTGNGTGASVVNLNSGAITSWSGNQTGTTTTGVVDLNRNGGAVNNTFNLNGGTLTINQVITNVNNGTVAFNFNGGTLKAAGNSGAFVALGGASQTANVLNGGAIIDSAGFNVTITQGLLAGSGSTGGLTKIGAGTLALNAPNTFTGGVLVNEGTLYVNPGNAATNRAFSYVSGITVTSGATLRSGGNGLFGWDGTQEKPILVNAGATLVADNGADIGVGTVTLAGGTLASDGTSGTWGSWRFDNPTDKLVATEDSTVSAVNVKFQNGGAIDVAAGKTLNVTGTITDSTNGGVSALVKSGGTGTLLLSGSSTYTGATSILAGTLQIGNGNGATLASGNYGGAITNNGTLIYNSTAAQSLTGGITGGGTLTKDGSGTLTTGGSSALGEVSVLAGGLIVGGQTTAGNISAADGTTFGVKAASAGATVLSLGSNGLTLGSGSFAVDFNALNPSATLLDMSTGTLTLNGAVTPTFSNASALTNGTYTLIDYGTLAGPGSFDGSTVALGARSLGAVSVDSGNTAIVLTVTADKPIWSGANGSDWVEFALNSPVSGSPNFALQSANTAADFWASDDVEFNDTYNLGAGDVAVTNSLVNIDAAGVNANTVTFNNSAVDYTISGSGAIAGSGSLVKNGTGKVTLTTTNSYSGATVINAGTLQLGDGTTDGNIDGTASLTNNGTLEFNRSTGSSFTYGNVISGSGGVVKSGAGMQILSAANSYTGGTTISGGVLRITTTAGAANLGNLYLNGGAFQVNVIDPNWGYNPTIHLLADSTIGNATAGATSGGDFFQGQINYTGTINGNGNALNVSSPGLARIYMNGAASSISQVNVLQGAMGLDMSGTGRLGGAPIHVADGASLWVAGSGTTIANDLTFNGGSGIGGLGALLYEGGSPNPTAITANITLAGGSTSIGARFAADTITLNGVITGSGGLTKTSANKYVLAGANDYAGGTDVQAGTLAVTGTGTLGTGNVTIGAAGRVESASSDAIADSATLTLDTGGTMLLTGGTEYVATLVLGGTTYLNGTFGGTGSGADNIFADFFSVTTSGNVVSVPEPSSLGLLALGGVGLLRRRRRVR